MGYGSEVLGYWSIQPHQLTTDPQLEKIARNLTRNISLTQTKLELVEPFKGAYEKSKKISRNPISIFWDYNQTGLFILEDVLS